MQEVVTQPMKGHHKSNSYSGTNAFENSHGYSGHGYSSHNYSSMVHSKSQKMLVGSTQTPVVKEAKRMNFLETQM